MTQHSTTPSLYTTADGSLTLYSAESGEHYHSVHGAVQESRHIFIECALAHRAGMLDTPRTLHLLEVGFGTGLNALLTQLWAERHDLAIRYTSLEKYPVPEEVYRQLSYPDLGDTTADTTLQALHATAWEEEAEASPHFLLTKRCMDLCTLSALAYPIDVVYFDAFSPEAQPELWTEAIFASIHALCAPGAVLTTYCAKGEVRRRLQRVGFVVERLPGPPGKREILRATRPLI